VPIEICVGKMSLNPDASKNRDRTAPGGWTLLFSGFDA